MAPINMGETKKSIFMYKVRANLLLHLTWMGHLQQMDDAPRKYTRPTYNKNNLRRDSKQWKDDVQNDIKKDENY
jgi:hypothetical protein